MRESDHKQIVMLTCLNALHAEVEALQKAIGLAEQFVMGRIIFSTDCLGLQQAVTMFSLDRAPLGTLFREAKFLLSLGFIEYEVEFKPRLCNKPAHVLANLGAREIFGSHAVSITDLPNDLTRSVADD